MLLLRCPNCRQNMKCLPLKTGDISKKRKRCVYCGRSFLVNKNLIENLS